LVGAITSPFQTSILMDGLSGSLGAPQPGSGGGLAARVRVAVPARVSWMIWWAVSRAQISWVTPSGVAERRTGWRLRR